jgi:hypothetical protein
MSQTLSISLTVTDAAGQTGTITVPLTLNPAALTVTAGTLPDATSGVAYSASFPGTVQGGTPPYHYAATGLPTGLSEDPSTGAISGTP